MRQGSSSSLVSVAARSMISLVLRIGLVGKCEPQAGWIAPASPLARDAEGTLKTRSNPRLL